MGVSRSAVLALCCAACAPRAVPELRLSAVELAAGAPAAALRAGQAALAADPHDAGAWAAIAAAQAALGQDEAAQASYRHAMAEDPGNLEPRLGLLRLRLRSDAVGAAGDLQDLATRHPHDARLWTDLGVAQDLALRPARAQAAYRRALAENPLLTSAQADLGLSLAFSGHAAEGAAMLAPLAHGAESTPRLRQDYGLALALAGDRGSAQTMLGQDLAAPQVIAALDGLRP